MDSQEMTNQSECMGGADLDTAFLRSHANVPGVVVIIIFYGVILVAGILGPRLAKRGVCRNKSYEAASTQEDPVDTKIRRDDNVAESAVQNSNTEVISKDKQRPEMNKVEDLILAGRNMGIVVGTLTMVATSMGGGFLNGTAQVVMDPSQGLVWCQAPLFYTLGMIANPFIFSAKMYKKGYRTLVDPIDEAFGKVQASILCIPSLLSDIFWSASILTALGNTLSTIAGLNFLWAVVLSEAVSILYTFTGGLYSVAYTDVVELVCIIIPLCIALPFATSHSASSPISVSSEQTTSWLGQLPEGAWISYYIDEALTIFLGGTCWQCYYQRVMAQQTLRGLYIISIVAGLLIFVVLIPVVLIGAVASTTDWNMTDYREFGQLPVPECDYPLALPMVMRFLTPSAVAVIGLGAVSAAVMSSTDSAALSTASLVTLHMYSPLRQAVTKSQASNAELQWTMRGSVLMVGVIATMLALYVRDTYGFLVLAGDMQFLLFPQLVAAVHIPFCNTYGSSVSFLTSLVLRLLSGIPTLNLPAYIQFPYYDQVSGMQMFPFRCCIVMVELILLVVVSLLTRKLAQISRTFRKFDSKTLRCFATSVVNEQHELK